VARVIYYYLFKLNDNVVEIESFLPNLDRYSPKRPFFRSNYIDQSKMRTIKIKIQKRLVHKIIKKTGKIQCCFSPL